MAKYYIYRHIRLDINQVFYIGKGTKEDNIEFKKFTSEYKRAFSKKSNSRNRYWKHVINITAYDIEIIFESDDYDFINKKEKEFIELYGRKDLGLGYLVNLTDGADGGLSVLCSEETKQKMRDSSWVKNKFGKSHHLSLTIYVYDISGKFLNNWGSIHDMCRNLKLDSGGVHQQIRGKILQFKGYRFYKIYQGENIEPLINYGKCYTRKKAVQMLSKNKEIIKIFNTVTEAANFVKTQTTNISKCCKNENKTCKGFYWKYN